jgi:hypothetical protein
MRVEEMGAEITQVPGIEYIRVERSKISERGVHVLIKYSDQDEPVSYGVAEFGEFAGAVSLASDRVQWLADQIGSVRR